MDDRWRRQPTDAPQVMGELMQEMVQAQLNTMQGSLQLVASWTDTWLSFQYRITVGLWPQAAPFLRHLNPQPPTGAALTDGYGRRHHDVDPEKL